MMIQQGLGQQRSRRDRTLILGGVGLFLAATCLGAGVGWLTADSSEAGPPTPPTSALTPAESTTQAPSPRPAPSDTATSPSTPTPSPSPSTLSKAELERQAYNVLEDQAFEDRQRVQLRGQWVAQLSSKYVGVRDPLQVTASGSHRFEALDILAEHRALRERFDGPYNVRLLRGQDFSPGTTHNGETFWYTFVLGDFVSRSDVDDFCRSAFPGETGRDLENQCLARRLRS